MKADGGAVRVAGHDVATEAKAVRAAIGVTGQFAAVDELLSGREKPPLGGGPDRDANRGTRGGARRLGGGWPARGGPRTGRRPHPGAGAAGSIWRCPWAATRGPSPWTSRRRAWTRAAAAPCGRSSASWWPTA